MSGHERSVNKYCTAVYKVQNLVRNNPFNWSESPLFHWSEIRIPLFIGPNPPFSLVETRNTPFSLVRIPTFHWSDSTLPLIGIQPSHWSELIGYRPIMEKRVDFILEILVDVLDGFQKIKVFFQKNNIFRELLCL